MKKLLILMLVLGLASSASALVVDLRADDVDTLAVTVTSLSPSVQVSVYSDTGIAGNYTRVVTTDIGIGTFNAMTITTAAGPDAAVTNPYYGYGWAYLVEAKDADPAVDPPNISPGEHFYFTYTATSFNADGSVQQTIDLCNRDLTWSVIETMVITQIPEPATIALLGLGSLFLMRRRRK